jgi:hypothetical protein
LSLRILTGFCGVVITNQLSSSRTVVVVDSIDSYNHSSKFELLQSTSKIGSLLLRNTNEASYLQEPQLEEMDALARRSFQLERIAHYPLLFCGIPSTFCYPLQFLHYNTRLRSCLIQHCKPFECVVRPSSGATITILRFCGNSAS